MSSTTNRRDLMTILGLGAAAAVMTPERVDAGPLNDVKGAPSLGIVSQAKFAKALRGLADAVEKGEVNIYRFQTTATMEPDNWVEQDLHIKLEVVEPPDA